MDIFLTQFEVVWDNFFVCFDMEQLDLISEAISGCLMASKSNTFCRICMLAHKEQLEMELYDAIWRRLKFKTFIGSQRPQTLRYLLSIKNEIRINSTLRQLQMASKNIFQLISGNSNMFFCQTSNWNYQTTSQNMRYRP